MFAVKYLYKFNFCPPRVTNIGQRLEEVFEFKAVTFQPRTAELKKQEQFQVGF
jgi:hypothetical protein